MSRPRPEYTLRGEFFCAEGAGPVLERVIDAVDGFVWGPVMCALLVGCGVYLSIRLGFLQVVRLPTVLRETFGTLFSRKRRRARAGSITPFQALSTALAGTMGTGNIVGVATAIVAGGPGAVFWMWVSALFGMVTKYAEVVLSLRFRRRNGRGQWVGGPMYVLRDGLGLPRLGGLYALLGLVASFGIGNMTQVNAISGALSATFGAPELIVGLLCAGLLALVILGGVKRIAKVAEALVPAMSLFYLACVAGALVFYRQALPGAIGMIFSSAFTPTAAIGGVAGYTVRQALAVGVARGVFTNEAGLGSAAIAHAAADTDSPVRQGFWGITEVGVDTLVSCTLTALVILSSGLWQGGSDGAALSTAAFSAVYGSLGGVMVSVALVFFAFSSMLGWSYYGERCLEYLTGGRGLLLYRLLFLAAVVVGAVMQVGLVWKLSDAFNGLMALPNLVAVLGLSPLVIKLTREAFARGGSRPQ
jgi:AGCS family alanine or glycine:cation symporter